MNNIEKINEVSSQLDSIMAQIKYIENDVIREVKKGRHTEEQMEVEMERMRIAVNFISNSVERMEKVLAKESE